MIKPDEAINMATTKEMNKVEQRFFDLLVLYTDFYIKSFFDGTKVDIDISDASIGTNSPISDDGDISKAVVVIHGKYRNHVTGSGRMPWWRQKIVIQNWIEAYEKAGWKVCGKEMKYEDTGYGTYEFKPDLRDMKLEEIGIK